MNHVYQFRDVCGPVKGVNSQLVCFCMAWWLERNLALNFPTSSKYINLGILNILGIIEQISVQQFYLTKQIFREYTFQSLHEIFNITYMFRTVFLRNAILQITNLIISEILTLKVTQKLIRSFFKVGVISQFIISGVIVYRKNKVEVIGNDFSLPLPFYLHGLIFTVICE